LDWSNGGYSLNLFSGLRGEFPEKGIEEIFVEVVKRAGCVAMLEPISAEVLRARPKANPAAPMADWPLLSELKNDELDCSQSIDWRAEEARLSAQAKSPPP
jgi:hypothetical protein